MNQDNLKPKSNTEIDILIKGMVEKYLQIKVDINGIKSYQLDGVGVN